MKMCNFSLIQKKTTALSISFLFLFYAFSNVDAQGVFDFENYTRIDSKTITTKSGEIQLTVSFPNTASASMNVESISDGGGSAGKTAGDQTVNGTTLMKFEFSKPVDINSIRFLSRVNIQGTYIFKNNSPGSINVPVNVLGVELASNKNYFSKNVVLNFKNVTSMSIIFSDGVKSNVFYPIIDTIQFTPGSSKSNSIFPH